MDVAYSRNKLALRKRLRNRILKSQFSIFNSFGDIRVYIFDFLKLVGGLWTLKWAWKTLFWLNGATPPKLFCIWMFKLT